MENNIKTETSQTPDNGKGEIKGSQIRLNDLYWQSKETESEGQGLYPKYHIQKIKGKQFAGYDFFEQPIYEGILEDVDSNAEYFVLRLDENTKDKKHLQACRIGINAYAKAIETHLPELSKDLIQRYPSTPLPTQKQTEESVERMAESEFLRRYGNGHGEKFIKGFIAGYNATL